MVRSIPFSIRQLQYLAAVVDTGGFGAAAKVCGVSQPSLSAQIAKLEANLGMRLFERHSRRVLATTACHELMPRVRRLLLAASDVEQVSNALADPYQATLRVGIIPTIAPYLLPEVVDLLHEQDRAPRFHWLELQTAICERELAEGRLDAMLIADQPLQPSVNEVEIGWEPFFALVPEHHPATQEITLEHLSRDEILLLEDGHCLRDHAMKLCMLPKAVESPYRSTSLPTLVQMVASGLGVTVLPASARRAELRRGRVRAVPLSNVRAGRTLRLAWRARSPYGKVLRELVGVLRQSLQSALEPLEGG